MTSSVTRSLTIIIVQAVHLSLPALYGRQTNVEVVTGDHAPRRTQNVKWKKGEATRWDSRLDFPFLDNSSKITITVIHESALWDKCLCTIDIELGDLLELQYLHPNEDVVLSMMDKKGIPTPTQLFVRVTQNSTSESAIASGAAEPTEISVQRASQFAIATLSDQQKLAMSFNTLMEKLKILVKIGDAVTKIHPYVNFAWQVLSVGLKMVLAKQARDMKILDLVRAMESTCSLVVSADGLKNCPELQDIVEQMLKQTIECGYFIRGYTKRGFGESAVTHAFDNVDEQIAAFCDAFTSLREDFDSRLSLSTALVVSRFASSVDMMVCNQVLKPVNMDEYNRTTCLQNTRLNVIKDVMDWIADDSDDLKKVLWIYGLAGTGKSTLSTTIAQIMRGLHRLGAFFFFNRDIRQRNFATLIRTLAYQLAMFDARFSAVISQVVAANANIAGMPLDFQFAKLLSHNALKSVEWFGGPVVLVIDALDECGSEADRKILMRVLSKGFSDLPWFIRIVVVSRQEHDIQLALGSHLDLRPYPLDVDSAANRDDVSEFVRHCLEEIRIKDGFLDAGWPGDDKINALASGAGGLFIWASTACLYIDSHDPDERLSELIGQQSESNSSVPFLPLDNLYKTGLQSANFNDPSFSSDCWSILGLILCAQIPLSYSVIDALLGLPQNRPARKSMSHLRCVLRISETDGIRILHPSFHDYLSERCSGEPWSINLDLHHKQLALCCIKLLDMELRENIGDMTFPHFTQKETLSEAISYACKFWIEHACLVDATDDIVDRIHDFLVAHLLHWMEALSLLKCHDHTIRSIQTLMKWLRKSSRNDTDLYQLVYDGHRFAQYFANTIMENPLLLYVTALPFTPKNTSIYKKFYRDGLPNVVCGMEKTWPQQLLQLQGHDDHVRSVRFSPDGSKIGSGSVDETIRVWDASTGVEILLLQGHDHDIASIAFSPNGSKIASGSRDKTIRIWDASTGAEILSPLQGHEDWIFSVTFSPDGTKIVSGSEDKTIRIWNANTGVEILPPLRGHDQGIRSLAFSPDGSKFVSGSVDKTIRIWDASTGIEILPPLRGHDLDIDSVAFDGSKIVSGSGDMTIRIWDARTGAEMLPPLRGHDGWVYSVALSPDGSKIVSGSRDKTIRVWDASTGDEILPPLQGHDRPVRSAAFSPDGCRIVSGSDDETIRIWDASIGSPILPPLRGHNDWIFSVAFSPDGTKIVSGSDDKTIRIWDANTGTQILPPLQGHFSRVRSVAFSPDGSKIVSGSDDETIRVWDANTGVEILPPLQGYDEWIHSLTFSADGSQIVSESLDETIRIWDASTGIELPYTSTAFNDIPRSAPHDSVISLTDEWFTDISTGRYLGRLPVGASFYGCQVRGSTFIGWTLAHKLVIIRFITQ